ncbi:MAG TPA: molecular chaperone HtpG [Candidatus Cloacimonetes bacterium]|nr:molecular chaperone HtpG [Candidatus Cloacimonadota bacterium]
MTDKKTGKLSIHTENIFPIIKKWLYSEHDIFLRELISNAIDAMNKRKAIDPEVKSEDLKIEIKTNKKKKTLEVIDYGIGMNATEIKKYINQIAFSGAEDFIEKYKDKQSSIIGHFGLGFYSSFMVAKKVTIDSLSFKKGSHPAFWECEGETEYKAEDGKRKDIGTTVTVHLNKDNEEYLEEHKIKELIEKYSNFMPFPIFLNKEKEAINQKEALWLKKPKDVTDEEYKEFYKKLFHDWDDPLFWIHLNVDFPFNLKGILYFPKIKNQLEMNQGKVKLFCNNVFVADDLKQIVPEFLLLLKGGIDIPDIPLNVSRSFLQHDQQVQKISQYIIRKIADSLKDIFKEDRKKYEGFWDDIHYFIKYGILSDEKFSEAMKDHIIFKTTQDDFITIKEYRERNKSKDKPQKIFYAQSEDTQVTYLNLMKEQGIEVIYSHPIIDSHLFQHLEMKDRDVTFVRIDSEINDNLIDKEKKEIVDASNRTNSDKLKEIFDKTLNEKIEASFNKDDYAKFIKKHPDAINTLAPYIRTKDDFTYIKPYDIPFNIREKLGKDVFSEILGKVYLSVTTEMKFLKTKSIPAMVVFNEFMRRFQEMNYLSQPKESDMLKNHTVIVNPENETIKKVLRFYEEGKIEEAKLLINYVHELALLEQKQFTGKELKLFIENSNKVLEMI